MEKSGIEGAGLATVAVGNSLAFLATLPLSARGPAPSATDVVAVLYLGVVQIGLGYVLLTRGIRRVSAVQTSLLMMTEPVFSPLWAYLLHGEAPGPWAVAGGAAILAATAGRLLPRSN
jgi:drug/metabolite transporter (DMT)-like permease